MNIGLIIAGGCGQRMHQDIPKQFINVYDKPIIIYTLEAFERHPDIDAILVVCLDGWQHILKAYSKQFGITKLKWIVPGGKNGQDSIRNGVEALAECCDKSDIVLIHDAIRPLISPEIISDSIAKCNSFGSAITAIPCNEAVLVTLDGKSSDCSVNRSMLNRIQTPQTFTLEKLLWAHKTALERGITNSVATCTMMVELGERLYFSAGSEKNIKITEMDDLDIFRALLKMQKEF